MSRFKVAGHMTRALLNAARAATFDRLGKPPSAPLMVYVELTRRCNMKCHHCDIWMSSQRHKDLAATEIPGSRLVEVLTGLSREGLLAVDLFGGEPLLRKDLPEIIGGLKRAGLHVTVTTNGALLTPASCQRIVDAGLDQLLVSIDGPDAESHDAIRGVPGTFEKAMRGLSHLTQLADGRLRVGINTLVCRTNLPLLGRMPELVKAVGAQQLRLLPYHQCYPFNQFVQDDELMVRVSDLPTLARSLSQVIHETRQWGIATNSQTYLKGIEDWYRGRPVPVRCQAGLSVCDINAFGDVYPCYTLAKPVGNILRDEFLSVWRSHQLDSHRRSSRECRQCWQSCYIEPGLRLSMNALWADRQAVLHDIMEYFVKR